MQNYRSEYSSSGYYNSSMSGGGHDYEYGAHNMRMAGGGRKQARHRYEESQALSNYGMDHYGMNRAGRYGEYGQAYNSNGSVVPYSAGVDHMNSTQYQMSKANTHYGGGYGGGHYLAKQKQQQQQRLQYGGMEYNAMNQQQMHHHKRSEKRMVRKMNAMSMSSGSCTTSRGINHNKGNYSDDDEYCTGSDSDDDDDNFGGNHCEDDNSGSDYERRRNYSRPMY